jgi:DNA-binding response OmpR family regulator
MAPSIFVVEDDPDIRELLSFTISRAGFDLAVAETAEEALRMLDVNGD